MKKCCMSFVFLALLFVFSACPAPGVKEDNSSYITKMKALSSKTFSYFEKETFYQDLDKTIPQGSEMRIKEQLVFSAFNEEENTITASLFSASWSEENKTQQGEKIKDLTITLSDFKILSSSLENTREIDNSITLENKTYECCSQEYKWAKILENKKWQWKQEIQREKYEFLAIDLENEKIVFNHYSTASGTETQYTGEMYYDIQRKQGYWSKDDYQYTRFTQIDTDHFFKEYGEPNDGGNTFLFVENWT